jgi:hypothetical protein
VTTRRKDAEVLTAKLTVILSDGGNRRLTSGDGRPRLLILPGHCWMLADGRNVVFKTVGSAKASRASSICMRGPWPWSSDRGSAKASPIRRKLRVVLHVVIRSKIDPFLDEQELRFKESSQRL